MKHFSGYSVISSDFDYMKVWDIAENFNIKIITTAAYSPCLLERYKQILTVTLLKVKPNHILD